MSNKKSSIERLKDLTNFLKINTGLTEEQLSVRAGYNKGYISQCLSRGKVPEKFIAALGREFTGEFAAGESDKKITIETDEATMVKDVIQLKALVKMLRGRLAKLEAKDSGRELEEILDEQDRDTILNLRDLASSK